MAEELTSSSEPAIKLTAQQWAWQFLRRNPEYLAAFEMISALSLKQFKQLNFLIDQLKELLISEDFLDYAVIRTLDLRFFEIKHFEMLDETIGSYIDRTRSILGVDERTVLTELKVSKRFWVETYCLDDWVDPVKCLDVDAKTAAKMWRYTPFIESGLVSAPWLVMLEGVDLDGLKSRKRSVRGKGYESNGLMLRGADGALFMRSATIWGHDYVKPLLGELEVDVRFDLSLPLEFQIKLAKEELIKQKNLLQSAKFLDKHPNQVDRHGLYNEYLSILDSLKNGANISDLALDFEDGVVEKIIRRRKKKNTEPVRTSVLLNPQKPFHGYEEITASVRQKVVRALKLRDQDYKALAFL